MVAYACDVFCCVRIKLAEYDKQTLEENKFKVGKQPEG